MTEPPSITTARHRLPVGLTVSMFVAAVSLGTMVTCWNLDWPTAAGLPLVAHVCAGLCLVWGMVSLILAGTAAHSISRYRADIQAVLEIAMQVAGLTAVVIMLYAAMTEALLRTIFFEFDTSFPAGVWTSGFIDLLLIAVALILGWRRTGKPALMTALFWLLILTGLWVSFQIPTKGLHRDGRAYQHSVGTTWACTLMLSNALVVAAFTALWGILENRRRARAWPNALHELTAPPVIWPGFRYGAGILAVLGILLGCVLITRPLTSVSAFLAGAALLTLVARRWEANLADAGIALMTLGVVALFMAWLPTPEPDRYANAARYAEIFNRALMALAVMTWFWHWLAAVWNQQLDNGRAWTTAGRLIRTLHRVGYLTGATAVLLSLHLALWPRFGFVATLDATPWRWAFGLSANALLILALAASTRRTRKPTLAWLAVFAAASTVAFALVRTPDSMATERWVNLWPVAMPLIAVVSLLIAHAAARSTTRAAFAEPLYLTGILVAPAAALAGIVFADRFTLAAWVQSATFALLAAAYLLAAFLPGPRRFILVAVLCAAMALWHLP